MRIAYLAHWAEQPNSGVITKIRAQTTLWKQKDHEVTVFLIVPAENTDEIEKRFHPGSAIRTFQYRSKFSWISAAFSAASSIMQWSPDILYCRQMTYHPAFSRLAYKIPTVIEVNTNDAQELNLRSWLGRWYGKGTRRLRYAFSRGLVCVTQELANAPEFNIFDMPKTVVANGIELAVVTPLPPPINDAPNLVFLGSGGQAWHGVDKIVQLANELPGWTFHLVGPEFADLGTEPTGNVEMYGHLNETAYLNILAISDVAIGTLALHRKGMDEACPLKVREYLAAGLPTIIGYNDTDFPEDVPFILRLPNTEENMDVHRITDFVSNWRGKRVERKDVLQLDNSAKEDSRLQFLESLVA